MKTVSIFFSFLIGIMASLSLSAPPPPKANAAADAHSTIAASCENEAARPCAEANPLPVRIHALGFAFDGYKEEECEKRQQEILRLAGDIMKMADPKAKTSPEIYLSRETRVLVVKVAPAHQEIIAEMVKALKENAAHQPAAGQPVAPRSK